MISSEKIDVRIRFDRDIKERLDEQAKLEHRNLSNMIGHACAVYLERVVTERVAA